jgi:hypothetical protein
MQICVRGKKWGNNAVGSTKEGFSFMEAVTSSLAFAAIMTRSSQRTCKKDGSF